MSQFVVKRFGSGDQSYVFPLFQKTFQTNFGQAVSRISRLPGVNGGFDEDGTGEQAGEIGNVRLDFTLVAEDEDDMEAARDAVKAMRSWGQRRLFIQPSDPALAERFCFAKARVNLTQHPAGHTDFFQPVSIDFSVAQPFWFTEGTEAPIWGSGITWGNFTWGGNPSTYALSGTVTDITEQVLEGNANTYPRFLVETTGGQTVQNVRIQRIIKSAVVDEVQYTGTISNGDVLTINCRDKQVLLNGVDAYSSAFNFITPEWFTLEPGANRIFIRMDGAGNAGTLKLLYFGVYR